MTTSDSIIDLVHEHGRLTVAEFMDLALYDPSLGYYARSSRRTGRAGDFFTSVDVGPTFGQLLAVQISEMARILDLSAFDLVEAGAGNGQLSADVLRTLAGYDPHLYARTRLHLVEASAAARDAQAATLADARERLASSTPALPDSFEGVLFANELLDAFPVHQVVMRENGLREVYVEAVNGGLVTTEGCPSTPALSGYLQAVGIALEPGWRTEINLAAVRWVRDAARRLARGFIVLIDYGHQARELFSVTHAAGTLASFSHHTTRGPEAADACAWLERPGECDITSHVDFTSVRDAAEAEGMVTLGLLDQTYFLMGLAGFGSPDPPASTGIVNATNRRAFSTLTMPGGLGSTMKVLIAGKDVGTTPLLGCSSGMRFT